MEETRGDQRRPKSESGFGNSLHTTEITKITQFEKKKNDPQGPDTLYKLYGCLTHFIQIIQFKNMEITVKMTIHVSYHTGDPCVSPWQRCSFQNSVNPFPHDTF